MYKQIVNMTFSFVNEMKIENNENNALRRQKQRK